MKHGLLLACLLLLGACDGCDRKATPSAGDAQQEVRVGGGENQRRLPFRIDRVYEQQAVSGSPPWHTSGGEYTFFDAHTQDGIPFGFGLRVTPLEPGSLFSFSAGLLTVPDSDAGARLVAAIAQTFGGQVPKASARQPLHLTPFGVAILARGAKREPDGSFKGPGSWWASKLFLQRRGPEAEVFLNFDLTGFAGEFSEKDAEYAQPMVTFLARELRDGPPAPRTSQSDPRVASLGVTLGPWRQLPGPRAQFLRFDQHGTHLLYATRDKSTTTLVEVALEDLEQRSELLQTDKMILGIVCTADERTCLLEQTDPSDLAVGHENGAKHFSLLRRPGNQVVALGGARPDASWPASAALSPDAAYLAHVGPRAGDESAARPQLQLHITPITATGLGSGVALDTARRPLDVRGWTGAGDRLRAVVLDGFDDDEDRRWLLVDPHTGETTPSAAPPAGMVYDESVSPDGKRRATCMNGRALQVTERSTGKWQRLTLDEAERRAVGDACEVGWAGARYLRFEFERPGLLDVETMQLSFPFAPDDEPESLEYAANSRWVAALSGHDGKGLRIARLLPATRAQ